MGALGGLSRHYSMFAIQPICLPRPWAILCSNTGHVPEEAYQCLWTTPLHQAAGQGHVEIVEILLSHGADVHATGCAKHTPLGVAVYTDHTAVVKVLLDHGADIKPEEGLLKSATMHNDLDLLRLLLENSDDEKRGDEDAKQAFVFAVQRKHTGVIELMRSYGLGKDTK